jgi:2-polyprenyl-3-methyl-5-hydroxy-6-metoxy-1,4-benzoquinol methylase
MQATFASKTDAADMSRKSRDLLHLRSEPLPMFLPLYEHVLARPEIASATSSLDVGCGPGLATQVFARKMAHVAGVDATPPFIEIAKRRLPSGDFQVAEMEALPYADASFDVVSGAGIADAAAATRCSRPVCPVGGVQAE